MDAQFISSLGVVYGTRSVPTTFLEVVCGTRSVPTTFKRILCANCFFGKKLPVMQPFAPWMYPYIIREFH